LECNLLPVMTLVGRQVEKKEDQSVAMSRELERESMVCYSTTLGGKRGGRWVNHSELRKGMRIAKRQEERGGGALNRERIGRPGDTNERGEGKSVNQD